METLEWQRRLANQKLDKIINAMRALDMINTPAVIQGWSTAHTGLYVSLQRGVACCYAQQVPAAAATLHPTSAVGRRHCIIITN